MLEYLNSDTLFNTIAMLRPERESVILVTEGCDDSYAINRHVDDSVTVLSGLGGKNDLVEASLRIDHESIRLTYFLVDSDYDRFTNTKPNYGRQVISSDGHDFVMDLVLVDRSVIFRVIESHARGRMSVIASLKDTSELVTNSIELASFVGLLRLISADHGLQLNLRDFPFGRLKSLPASASEIVELALDRSRPIEWAADRLTELLENATREYRSNTLELVGDHDFFSAVARVMKDADYGKVSASVLASSFLAATHCSSLARTHWFRELARRSESDSGSSCFTCPCEEGVVA